MTLTNHDLSELLAALKAGNMTETVRTSLAWVLQALIEAEVASRPINQSSTLAVTSSPRPRSCKAIHNHGGSRTRQPRSISGPAMIGPRFVLLEPGTTLVSAPDKSRATTPKIP